MSEPVAGLTARLAEHVDATRYEHLPAAVVAAATRGVLDTIGVAMAAARAPGVAAIAALAIETGGRPDSRIWGASPRVPSAAAALVNSLAASALDFDDYDSGPGHLHADMVLVPAALAVGERVGASGRAVLEALVAAHDLACRVGRSLAGKRGWYLTSAVGVFGAAAAAAKLMGLGAQGIRHALGIALAQAAGTHQSIVEQVLAKRLQGGLAARAGVFAAELAARGITAPAEALEGRYGFYAMYQAGDPARALEDLGRRWSVVDTTFKQYPTCALNHAAVDGVLDLVSREDVRPDDVSGVRVGITPYMARLVGGDFRPQADPQVAAQFSLKYNVAAAILRRRVGIAEIEPSAVLDPRVRSLAARVELTVDPDGDGEFEPANVELSLRDGRRLGARVTAMRGTAANPLGAAALRRKFLDNALAGGGLSEEAALALADRIERLESSADVAGLMSDAGAHP